MTALAGGGGGDCTLKQMAGEGAAWPVGPRRSASGAAARPVRPAAKRPGSGGRAGLGGARLARPKRLRDSGPKARAQGGLGLRCRACPGQEVGRAGC